VKKFIAALALLTLPMTIAAPALADDHDFSIMNSTGAEVKAIYYKRTGDAKDPWTLIEGDAGDVVWAKGEDSPVKLDSRYDHDCEIDLKVVTKNGDQWTCGPVSLCDKDGNGVTKKIKVWMQGKQLKWSNQDE
jgi:hypothetical protein